MSFNLASKKIEVFSGINDQPVPPSPTKAGNGSHLVQSYNELIDRIESALDEVCPCTHSHWHQDSHVISGSQLLYNFHDSQFFKHWWVQYPADLNDSFKFDATLKKGQYNLKVLTTLYNDSGILALEIDGNRHPAILDLYSPDFSLNNYAGWTFSVDFSGRHEFKFIVIDKNQLSSGYQIPASKFAIYPVDMYS